MQVNAYLHFNGQCEEAFHFYVKSLGAKIETMMTHEGTPAAQQVPAEWQKKILHGRLIIGDQVVMASDAPPGRYSKPEGFFISLGTKDPGEAERLFRGLSDGANVIMPMQETFWASRFAMLIDRFGIPWMINCEKSSGSDAGKEQKPVEIAQ